MELLTPIGIAALATWQSIEIWHHSALFAGLRARVELWEGWIGDLLQCPHCLGPWVACGHLGLLMAGQLLPELGAAEWAGFLVQLPGGALAACRVAQVCNDLTHGFCRTPKIDADIGESDDDGEDRER